MNDQRLDSHVLQLCLNPTLLPYVMVSARAHYATRSVAAALDRDLNVWAYLLVE